MSKAPTAVVTGAASGIGRALAEVLAERGSALHLVDVDATGLAAVGTAVRAGGTGVVSTEVLDVASSDDMAVLAERTGAVDLLCLNAGVLGETMGAPWEASPQEWDRVLSVNLHGVVNGLRAFVPLMVQDGSPRHILVTASLAGGATWPGGGPYAASKHAVLAVAEQAALALSETAVSVSVLCPALVRSAMSPEGEEPREVASNALRACDEGAFAIFPEEWRSAVRQRSYRLADGRQPRLPVPD